MHSFSVNYIGWQAVSMINTFQLYIHGSMPCHDIMLGSSVFLITIYSRFVIQLYKLSHTDLESLLKNLWHFIG